VSGLGLGDKIRLIPGHCDPTTAFEPSLFVWVKVMSRPTEDPICSLADIVSPAAQ